MSDVFMDEMSIVPTALVPALIGILTPPTAEEQKLIDGVFDALSVSRGKTS